jgi:hypothetical protein
VQLEVNGVRTLWVLRGLNDWNVSCRDTVASSKDVHCGRLEKPRQFSSSGEDSRQQYLMGDTSAQSNILWKHIAAQQYIKGDTSAHSNILWENIAAQQYLMGETSAHSIILWEHIAAQQYIMGDTSAHRNILWKTYQRTEMS